MKRLLIAASLLLLISTRALAAQTATSLSQIKTIFIDSPADTRTHLADSLHKDSSLQLVTDPTRADATLKATSEVWVKAYVQVNPRASATRFPVYGGFLSAQLIGRDGDTLWSYLVTPSKYSSSGVRQVLADQLSRNLLLALHAATPTPSASTTLTLAGATFPAPLYQSWIDSFHRTHPNIHITYNRIGSGIGIEQLRNRQITIAASDVPLTDAQLS
jgi:PBP superfamily domain